MMGITNSNKQINTDQIDCNGTLKITLALSAAPDIASNPTDIVLVLDRSGSMTGQKTGRSVQEAGSGSSVSRTAQRLTRSLSHRSQRSKARSTA